MTDVMVRCLYCGPLWVSDAQPVADIHRHATSQAHRDLVALDAELEEKVR